MRDPAPRAPTARRIAAAERTLARLRGMPEQADTLVARAATVLVRRLLPAGWVDARSSG